MLFLSSLASNQGDFGRNRGQETLLDFGLELFKSDWAGLSSSVLFERNEDLGEVISSIRKHSGQIIRFAMFAPLLKGS